MSKVIKEIQRAYTEFKFINGTKHLIAIHKLTGNRVVIARTPSDRRAKQNICKMLDKYKGMR